LNAALLESLEHGSIAITSNLRLARALRHDFGEAQRRRGLRAWRSPSVMTWQAWMEQFWREALYTANEAIPALLTKAQELALWETIIVSGDSSLLHAAATARAAQSAWRLLHEWRLPLDDGAWLYHEDGSAFLGWAREFERRLDAANRIDESRWPDRAMRLGRHPRNVWLAGFDELTPRQLEFVRTLESAGTRVTHLIEPPHAAPASLVQFASAAGEMEAVAHWARGEFERDPEQTIGVIVPGLGDLRDEIDHVFSRVFHADRAPRDKAFHIALGPPLSSRPAVSAALAGLEFLKGRLPIEIAGRILLSPYFGGGVEERPARADFDAALGKRGYSQVDASLLIAQADCPPMLRAHLSTLAQHGGQEMAPSGWIRAATLLLRNLGWPGGETSSSEQLQVINAWGELLSEVASLDAVTGPISAGKACAWIGRCAGETIFEVENLAQPVQILGVEESRGATFDKLWIVGLNDEIWPPAPSPRPFIPASLQRRCGVPQSSPALSLAYARRATARMLSSAAEVFVSFAAVEGERTLNASPLVTSLPKAKAPVYQRVRPPLVKLESLVDVQGPPLPAGAGQQGGARVLELEAACPFRAFAQLRLSAQPLESPRLGLSPQERGTLVHLALERYWTNRDVVAAVRHALDEKQIGRTSILGAKLRQLEEKRLVALLNGWLEVEKLREGRFEVLPAEQWNEVELGGVNLRTRPDRMDRLEDGRCVLIDYKTSTHSPSEWEGDRPDDPQLPLYAITTAEPLAAVAFAQVRPGEHAFRGAATSEHLLPGAKIVSQDEFDAKLSEWRRVLAGLAAEFSAGRAEPDPKRGSQTCRNCHLATLCRIHEQGMEVADE
jgi:probable DNA repair protein